MSSEISDIKVTVDVVVYDLSKEMPRILLVRRRNPPFRGSWALPGGFVEPNESLKTAARRELEEETGVVPKTIEQFRAFGEPGRDPRGPTVSIAFIATVGAKHTDPRAGSDAADARWFSVDGLPKLAFDHADIVEVAGKVAEI